MADDAGLAADALSGLEDESRDAALGVLYGASADARQRLQNLVLRFRNAPALAGAVRAFLSEHRGV